MRTLKFMLALFCVLGALVPAIGFAQTPLKKGYHYDLIDPAQPTETAGKIEVIEFFSYGCPHCYHLEPSINPWVKQLSKDVGFYRVPLSGGQWAATAKLFYTLDAMGVEDKLHSDVFAAIHGDKSIPSISDEAAIAAWASNKGLDARKFADTYKSFAVQSKVQRAALLANSHHVSGVPALVVDGRYLVLSNSITSYDELLTLTSHVIAMARADHKK